ncbi:MAG: DUF1570 domain-containing protein [Phycisphaerales bacterium]|nr:DUF1570 domain-containing protein [Phycisphaerales bacterium]
MRNIRGNRKWVVTVCVTLAIGRALPPSHAQRLDAVPTGPDAEWCDDGGQASCHECAVSEHFVVAHQIPEDALNEHLKTMEAAYDDVVRFLNAHGINVPRVEERMRATFMPYREKRHEARWVCGSTRASAASRMPPTAGYQRDKRYSWFALRRPPDDTGESGTLAATVDRLTIRHEIAHQVLDRLVPTLNDRIPSWLAEGLACAFEPDADGRMSGSLAWNKWRAADAIERLNAGDADAFLRALLTDAGTAFDNPAADEADTYAVAWALVYCAQRKRPAAFAGLLQQLAAEHGVGNIGDRWVDRFADVFGKPDGDAVSELVSCLTDASDARAQPSTDRAPVLPPAP